MIEGRALATEQDFTADKIVQDETPAGEGMMSDYAEYVDPKYAEKVMAESLSMADEPAPSRKGPVSETSAEPAAEQAVTESGS